MRIMHCVECTVHIVHCINGAAYKNDAKNKTIK